MVARPESAGTAGQSPYRSTTNAHGGGSVAESGFLGDYSQLKPGHDAKLVYIDSSVDWNKYNAVYIERVELWHSEDPESKLGRLSREDQELLVSFFYTALHTNLAKDFHLADQRGPGVLVVHCAITEAKKSRQRLANLARPTITLPRPGSKSGKAGGVWHGHGSGRSAGGRRISRRRNRPAAGRPGGSSRRHERTYHWSEHLDQRLVELRKEYK